MELEELKLFLRVDGNEEDSLIKSLQAAAEEYLTDAGIMENYNKEKYKLAVKILVNHWYENRAVETIGKNVSKVAFGLDTILIQLKYSQGDVI